MGKKTAEEIAAELRPKFRVFTKDELLTGMEYARVDFMRHRRRERTTCRPMVRDF